MDLTYRKCILSNIMERKAGIHEEAVAIKENGKFQNEWVPKDYLRTYYSELESDEVETIKFFVDAMKKVDSTGPVLFFGTGPTLHHVFLTAPKAAEIHLVDYLPENLQEIKKWVDKEEDAHDWSPFVKYTLQCEGNSSPTDEDINEREEMVRRKITKFMTADAGQTDPLSTEQRESYGLVLSPYCADSATGDKKVWKEYMRNITSLVKPGGTFITAALRDCSSYEVGEKEFPCANVNEKDMKGVLGMLDFSSRNTNIEYRELEGHGYTGIVLAHALKNFKE
jgi:hypothetical protein